MNQTSMIRFGECFRVKHGYAFKGEHFVKSGNYVVLTPGNFREHGGLKSQGEKEKYYSATPPDEYILSAGDLLIVMTDLTQEARILGSPAIIPRNDKYLHNQRLGLVTQLDQEKLTKEYLYYLLNWSFVRDQIKATATGSTVRHTAPDRIHAVQVSLPSLDTQRCIVSILSAYDDLIENNTRRIEILEEMARRLYEEWFVQFRFPGHEGVEFKESELGLIPEGWGIQPLYDVAEVTYGHPFKASQFNEDGVGLGIVRIRDIKAGEVKTYTSEEGKPKHLIENGDILIGMDGQFHMGKWAGGQAWLVQRVARFRPIQVGRYFLFLSLERPIKHLENTIVGTTVAHLSAKDLQKLHVVVPEKAVLDAASSFLEPLYDLEMKLRRKNANLRAQRDLLIPKLISGEIDVSDIPMPT
ncbi:restriction endonuclease subunit S [Pseudomonas guariconensis]|uniref:restriction endonuclease subunit S n=1 Tax=Pseudomonas guariconensis TaxID=1288410 RepID=UPI0034670DF6